MLFNRPISIVLLLALFCSLPAGGSPSTDAQRQETVAQLERTIPQLMKDGEVPGLSIALVRDGKLVWQRGFGVKSVSTNEPVGNDTVFEAASLSKPVFAYAVLRMVDRGLIDLDAPLTKYLPAAYVEGDARLNLITARMVLSHRTGFPNWRPRGGPLKIHFTPGERFSYSGEGFVYLQKAVEHLTGQPLDALMRKMVFEPLGMTGSSYVWQERFERLKATGHDAAGNVTELRKPAEANAAASLHTTAGDYARFMIAIMKGTGLKSETLKQMLSPQVKVDEVGPNSIARRTGNLSSSLSWGLGWGLEQTANEKAFWHWGRNNDDVQCFTISFERERAGLVVFTNSGNGLSIIPELVARALGGTQHPAFAWTNTEPYDSPARLLLKAILTEGAGSALKRHQDERRARPATALSEARMNALGYNLLQRNRVAEAIEVFKLNVADYPQSANVYDSLAEAYMKSGERELAVRNYKRSVELNPDNTNAVEMLKKLQSQ
jgi:CubicO group peptidase (beta-lactamase class C family)